MIKIFKKYIFIVLAIISLFYIVVCDMLMTFSVIMNFCFIATSFLFIALYITATYPINYKKRGPSFRYIFIKTLSAFYFSIMIFLILFNVFYPKYYVPRSKKYDYIIVFGAGISNNKTEIINSRIDKAVEYANIYENCKFVLTGAKGDNEPIEEAYYMKNYMVERGIDENKILVDTFSVNTSENIVNSLELIELDIKKRNKKESIIKRPYQNKTDNYDLDFLDIGFMSSEFHLTRIVLMAKNKGIKNPYVIPCNTKPIYLPYQYVRENLSIFKALVLNQLKI